VHRALVESRAPGERLKVGGDGEEKVHGGGKLCTTSKKRRERASKGKRHRGLLGIQERLKCLRLKERGQEEKTL